MGSRNDRWFYVDVQGSPQVVVHSIPSFPLLRSLLTLCYFPMVWHGPPPHPMKPKCAEFGLLRPGPKFCQAQLPRAHLAVVVFKTSFGSLLKIVQLLHQCYNLHILWPLLLMCMKCCAPGRSAPPTLQAPMPPSISSATSAQIVRPGNNVQEYQKAYNASTGDHWFCLRGKKLSRSVQPSSSTFEQHCKTSQQHLRFMHENRPFNLHCVNRLWISIV